MRRLVLLLAAGSLWLFLAAVPALADGGPHVASVNSGVTSLTADGCAGCHRAHTAQGEGLLTAATEEALCLSCHNATATGAATDVMTGVQYVKSGIAGNDKSTGPILGYLRDGGFQQAHLGSSDGELIRVGYNRATDTVSFRMKVPTEATPENITSAHLDLDGAGGVTAKDKIWGNGVANAADPVAEIGCASCHNPHGNQQYRILNTLNTNADVVNATAVSITNVVAATDRFFTNGSNGLIVGDIVTISGVTGATPDFNTAGKYIVKSIAGNAFTVAPATILDPITNLPTSANIANTAVNVTADGTGGTVKRWSAIVDDAPLPGANDNRNYTVIQVRGTQGTNSTYMLYESDVLDARTGANAKNAWAAGTYTSGAGDYFHRTVPWNPAAFQANCNTLNPIPSGQCPTANDAPNGRPATVTTVGAGAVAYNDQITAWCSTCHTRYYSATNPNPGDEPSSNTDVARNISGAAGNVITVSSPDANGTTITSTGFSVGDRVTFSDAAVPTTEYYVVVASAMTFQVSTTLDGAAIAAPASTGTVVRAVPFAASSWYFPRPGDTRYKYQHQTTTNRACTTCHVGHGTDAKMPGGATTNYSGTLGYPDGSAATAGYNSRLLKIDNRGTCQACHDPTTTATAGTVYGTNPGANVVP